ncbi:hypothetical protein X759_31985 [Mesorhizobium sp. LSHC420B00]|nr:hypothetical protein X759_31985 [Mesorhizobium sp. LSHC420B00]
MITAGKLNVSGAFDMRCQVAPLFRFYPAVARRLHDQCRDVNGWEKGANIDFSAPAPERDRVGR